MQFKVASESATRSPVRLLYPTSVGSEGFVFPYSSSSSSSFFSSPLFAVASCWCWRHHRCCSPASPPPQPPPPMRASPPVARNSWPILQSLLGRPNGNVARGGGRRACAVHSRCFAMVVAAVPTTTSTRARLRARNLQFGQLLGSWPGRHRCSHTSTSPGHCLVAPLASERESQPASVSTSRQVGERVGRLAGWLAC